MPPRRPSSGRTTKAAASAPAAPPRRLAPSARRPGGRRRRDRRTPPTAPAAPRRPPACRVRRSARRGRRCGRCIRPGPVCMPTYCKPLVNHTKRHTPATVATPESERALRPQPWRGRRRSSSAESAGAGGEREQEHQAHRGEGVHGVVQHLREEQTHRISRPMPTSPAPADRAHSRARRPSVGASPGAGRADGASPIPSATRPATALRRRGHDVAGRDADDGRQAEAHHRDAGRAAQRVERVERPAARSHRAWRRQDLAERRQVAPRRDGDGTIEMATTATRPTAPAAASARWAPSAPGAGSADDQQRAAARRSSSSA